MVGKPSKKTLLLLWALGSGVCLIIGGLLAAFLFDVLVNAIIASKVPLLPGTDIAKAWMKPPVKPLLKIYYFNVTNPKDYLSGEKVRVEEIGPYVYEEKWERENVSWSDENQQVRFRMKKTYFYRPDLTVGSLDDVVTLPNVPLLAMFNKMRKTGPDVLFSANFYVDTLEPPQSIFESRKVEDVTWGYQHPLVDLANQILPDEEKLPPLYGYFYGKNESADGEFLIETGREEISKLGSIVSFNNENYLTKWGNASTDAQCNKIHGTDGSLFPPFVSKNHTFFIFQKDLCRALPITYSETVMHHGLESYRFIPSPEAFSPQDSPCFCSEPKGCAPKGMFNVSACQGDAPMLLSWPHFYNGDPSLQDQIDGLAPNKAKHEFGIDIMPQLGVGLRAAIRLQINVFIETDGITALSNSSDAFLPIVWFDDGIEELNDADTISLLKSATVEPGRIRSILYPVLLVIGSCLLLFSLVRMGLNIRSKRKTRKIQNFQMDNK